jgi:hypothetical protein
MLFVRFCKHLHPTDDAAFRRLFVTDGRNIILRFTGHDAGLATGAAIQIYDHAPQRHVMPS